MSHDSAIPTADQVRAIRIAALELLLAIEMAGGEADATFAATLYRLAENPVGAKLQPPMEAAR
jgi:hypothetical protein